MSDFTESDLTMMEKNNKYLAYVYLIELYTGSSEVTYSSSAEMQIRMQTHHVMSYVGLNYQSISFVFKSNLGSIP